MYQTQYCTHNSPSAHSRWRGRTAEWMRNVKLTATERRQRDGHAKQHINRTQALRIANAKDIDSAHLALFRNGSCERMNVELVHNRACKMLADASFQVPRAHQLCLVAKYSHLIYSRSSRFWACGVFNYSSAVYAAPYVSISGGALHATEPLRARDICAGTRTIESTSYACYAQGIYNDRAINMHLYIASIMHSELLAASISNRFCCVYVAR